VDDEYRTAFGSKVILFFGSGDNTRQKRESFNNEVWTLSVLDSPQIIRIYRHFPEGNLFVLIHGSDLETEIGISRASSHSIGKLQRRWSMRCASATLIAT
jgi:hypothetical protein